MSCPTMTISDWFKPGMRLWAAQPGHGVWDKDPRMRLLVPSVFQKPSELYQRDLAEESPVALQSQLLPQGSRNRWA